MSKPTPTNPQRSPKTNSTPRSKTSSDAEQRGGVYEHRTLPHDLEAERALLGSLLLEDTAIGEAINVLQELGGSAFWFEKHQKLYDAIIALWNERRPLDGVVMRDELQRDGLFEELGGFEFLGTLINSVPSALHVREYAQIVYDKALLRQLIGATHRVLDTAYEQRRTPADVLDYAESEIFNVTEQRVAGGAQLLPDLVEEVFKRIQDLDGRSVTGEPTGYYELDEITCGLQPSELIIIAARPSMGKTALGLNMAEHMALATSPARPVLFFSLEMSAEQVAQRILCSRARVDAQRLRRGLHSQEEMQRLLQAADEIRGKPLLIDDTSSLSILEMRARARMAYRKHAIRAVFVDYLQLARAPGSESRQQEVAEISRGLKALAKELEVPVVAMAQLNRKPEDRTSNRPRMSDLRESGAIEQDADLIALLHRDAYFKVGESPDASDDAAAELIIAKQRNGPVGTIELLFNRKLTRFDNPVVGDQYGGIPETQGGL